MAGNKKVVVLLAAILSAVVGFCSAATITVGGDTTGWTIPNSPAFYSTWASKQKFHVGDSLVFKFPAGMHTVAEVSKAAYDSCSSSNPLSAVLSTAPANITIRSPGTHYYICTVTGHCSSGQKFAIVAAAASSGPSPAPKSSKPKKAASPAPAPSHTSAAPAFTPSGAPAAKAPASPAPGTATPPSGNYAAPNAAGLGFFGLISVAAAAALLV